MTRIQFTTEGIGIRTSHGPQSVIAHCAGGLAYHESVTDPRFCAVTHVASGLALICYCTEREARKAIRVALETEEADWTQEMAYIDTHRAEYRASLRAMKIASRPG